MTTATDNFTEFTEWCRESYHTWPRGTMGRRDSRRGILVGPLGKLVMLATDVNASAVIRRPQPTPVELRKIEYYLGLSIELWSEPTRPHEKGVLTILTACADEQDVDGFIESLDALL